MRTCRINVNICTVTHISNGIEQAKILTICQNLRHLFIQFIEFNLFCDDDKCVIMV